MTQPSFLHVASAPAQIPLHAKAGQFQAGAGRAHPQARQLLASLVAACVALGTTAPSVALAGPAEEAQAQALSAQGVEAYKKGDFVTAVGLFEQALQLSPGNPFYLRYAGRAWLALSHFRKAQPLLDVYLSVEKEEKNRKAIEDLMAPWRKKSPRDIADALYEAVKQFPMAAMEADCARQYEEIGDESSLERAAQVWEWAASRSRSPDQMDVATKGKARVDARLADVKKQNAAKAAADKAAADKAAADKAAAERAGTLRKTDAAGGGLSKGAQSGLYAGGGGLVIGGAALLYLGMSGVQAVDDDGKAGVYKGRYSTYESDRAAASNLYYAGIGTAVVGAGLLAATVLLGGKKDPAKASWQVAAQVGGQGNGLVLSGQF